MLLSVLGVLAGCGSATADPDAGVGSGQTISIVPTDNKKGWNLKAGTKAATAEGVIDVKFISATASTSSFSEQSSLTVVRDLADILYRNVIGSNSDTRGNIYPRNYPSGMDMQPSVVCTKTIAEIKNAMDLPAMEGIAKSLQSIVIAVLVCMWMVQFVQQVVQERFTMESLLKGFCQLILGAAIILKAPEITTAFISLGDEIFEKIASANSAVDWRGWCDIGAVRAILLLVLPFIGELICAYQIVSQLFTRMIELMIRVALSPIPFTFGGMNGFGPSSISFIKSTLACACQPALIILACKCFSSVLQVFASFAGGTLTSVLGSVLIFGAFIVLSGFLGQTKQLAQEIIAR